MNKTKIFLLRHGQTQWNVEGRLQGQKNSPLTEMGVNQSVEASKLLNQYEIDKAYISPLQRAIDTSEILLKGRDVEVITSDPLKEIYLGEWEGKLRAEVECSAPEQYQLFLNSSEHFELQGAETFQQLQTRLVAELEAIFAKEKHKNIMVVSHWIAIKTILAHYSDIPLSRLSEISDPENATLIQLEKDDSGATVVK
ncbi:phosphoglycerate mutase family protein [Vibrio halioticoli NBRC 102217]|uniref:Phosphoglycerate mutase family protein n=1 Tax=Vibrio halioticoli NBRC 102217 TaxID=1219072 RepID=V5FP43_9VIBR|nr:histidine phosphatase family protein [Vibrio halioticoli]GAD90547.1 phosphoglycerate mutase family protein [Vibrio halioticoli NBRC 102217]